MIDEGLRYRSAAELGRAFAAGSLSPRDVVDNALAVVDELDPVINALYVVDVEGARREATASADRWAAGSPMSPLDGVPTVVKDGLDLAGWPNHRGSAADPGTSQVGTDDAPSVARQREAGMVVLGKATMCDYGMLAAGVSTRHGVTRNPWDPTASTSGSSGGTAAAIAAGMCPLGVGTDIVGSVRHPAAFCGLVGLKPSEGRVPYMPPGSPGLAAGPLARSVDDLVLLLDVIAAPDGRDITALPPDDTGYAALAPAPLAGVRFGVIADLGLGLDLDREVGDALGGAITALVGAGAVAVPIDPPFAAGAHRPLERYHQARCGVELGALPRGERGRSPIVSEWAARADDRSAVDAFVDIAAIAGLREATMALMQGVDFLVMPTVPVPPYAAEAVGEDPDDFFLSWCNTFLFNVTGQPAISLPCGLTAGGLPIGLQLVGPRFDDRGVLRVARSVEAVLDPIWS